MTLGWGALRPKIAADKSTLHTHFPTPLHPVSQLDLNKYRILSSQGAITDRLHREVTSQYAINAQSGNFYQNRVANLKTAQIEPDMTKEKFTKISTRVDPKIDALFAELLFSADSKPTTWGKFLTGNHFTTEPHWDYVQKSVGVKFPHVVVAEGRNNVTKALLFGLGIGVVLYIINTGAIPVTDGAVPIQV